MEPELKAQISWTNLSTNPSLTSINNESQAIRSRRPTRSSAIASSRTIRTIRTPQASLVSSWTTLWSRIPTQTPKKRAWCFNRSNLPVSRPRTLHQLINQIIWSRSIRSQVAMIPSIIVFNKTKACNRGSSRAWHRTKVALTLSRPKPWLNRTYKIWRRSTWTILALETSSNS